MLTRFRQNHSALAAYLALFVALSGTAYAAATITGADVVDSSLTGADIQGQPASSGVPAVNGSLTTYDIQDGTLRSNDILNESIGGGKIKDGSLKASDLGPDSVNSAHVADKSLTGLDFGEDVITGANVQEKTLGEVPSAATAGVRGWKTALGTSAFNHSEGIKSAKAVCPPGTVVVGGGGGANTSGIAIASGEPRQGSAGESFYVVSAFEVNPIDWDWVLFAYAVCVDH